MNGTFKLEVELGNAAMQGRYDIIEALTETSERLKHGDIRGIIMDVNGNNVGKFWME